MRITNLPICVAACLISSHAYSADNDPRCFAQASARYAIPVPLLKAISHNESGGNARAVHRNKNGTEDIGHMQINSAWLPRLAKYGIDRKNLFDPCLNTQVGAWVLANNFANLGYNWKAVDAYNTSSPKPISNYTMKVSKIIQMQSTKGYTN